MGVSVEWTQKNLPSFDMKSSIVLLLAVAVWNQCTAYPQHKIVNAPGSYSPQTNSYPQSSTNSQTGSLPQTTGNPQTGSYPQTGGYPQLGGYPQSGGYPQTGSYPQTGGYPQS